MITLYDLAATAFPGETWSPNVCKTMYTLNFKGIPYKTEWVEFPDIKGLYEKLGVSAIVKTPDGRITYPSLPLIHDSSTGKYVSDSAVIAQYLDDTYPDTPKLFPAGSKPLQYAFMDAHFGTLSALWQFQLPKSHGILNEESQKYFKRTRASMFGFQLDGLMPEGEKFAVEWEKMKAGFEKADSWYQKGKAEGPFLMGKQPCFSDFLFVAWARFLKTTWGEDSEQWKDVKTWGEGRVVALVDACSKYERVL